MGLSFDVLGIGFLQDGDVAISIFPERQEILIGGFCLARVSRESIGSAELQPGERTDRVTDHYGRVIEDLLKFGNRVGPLTRRQVSLATHIHWK